LTLEHANPILDRRPAYSNRRVMVDVVDPATRSRMMSGIKGKDTRPELFVRKGLWALGFRFRVHVIELPGKPDLVFRKYGAVVFVNGCFWHRHKNCKCAAVSKTNPTSWAQKLDANCKRDLRNARQLRALGWRVLTIWECQLNERKLERLAKRIRMDFCADPATR